MATNLKARPVTYLITDGSASAVNFPESSKRILTRVESAVFNNISLVQIREKRLPARLLYELAVAAAHMTRGSSTRLLINDRADVAFASGADGVHLTSRSVSPDVIRAAFPGDFVIGVSTHTIDEAETAKRDGADFAVFGPVFASPGKAAVAGVEMLRTVCARVAPFPILGLGGIDETNYREVSEAADGFAAIRFLNDVSNMAKLREGSS